MLARGKEKFLASLQRAEEQGRAAEAGYARSIMPKLILRCAEALNENLYRKPTRGQGGARHAKIQPHLRKLDPYQVVFFAMRCIINGASEGSYKGSRLQAVAMSIGEAIEDELLCVVFEKKHAGYLAKTLKSMDQKGTTSNRHKHRVVRKKAADLDVGWNSWSNDERVITGLYLIDLVINNTDLIKIDTTKFRARSGGIETRKNIVFTPDTKQWIEQWIDFRSGLYPDYVPMVVPPRDWTGYNEGGYLTPAVNLRCPMVKVRSKAARRLVKGASMEVPMKTLNALQRVPRAVNGRILEVLRQIIGSEKDYGLPRRLPYEIPPSPFPDREKDTLSQQELEVLGKWKREARDIYSKEAKRASQVSQFFTVFAMADAYKDEEALYFVYQYDFRGRAYATTPLSPQGTDVSKSLLTYAMGKELGPLGVFWLGVHGANKFGFDKVSYEDRYIWAHENGEAVLACAQDPISNTWWLDADKPYQFLAWCFEWAEVLSLGGDAVHFVSHIPIGQDGTCNGLQHFSAMLRDPVAGKSVNLIPSPDGLPADVYGDVAKLVAERFADLCEEVFTQRTSPEETSKRFGLPRRFHERDALVMATRPWTNLEIDRSVTKKSVMTLSYGSTHTTWADSLIDHLGNHTDLDKDERVSSALLLTPILAKAIYETLVSSQEIMKWLQEIATVCTEAGEPLIWTTPTGFPIYQGTLRHKSKCISTKLCGGIQVYIPEQEKRYNLAKQRAGASPNFVHSNDGAHMQLVVNAADEEGMAVTAIHDDFGVHAADTERFRAIIRQTFVDIYEKFDPLDDLYRETQRRLPDAIIPPPPAKGDLDIRDVLRSEFFFG